MTEHNISIIMAKNIFYSSSNNSKYYKVNEKTNYFWKEFCSRIIRLTAKVD